MKKFQITLIFFLIFLLYSTEVVSEEPSVPNFTSLTVVSVDINSVNISLINTGDPADDIKWKIGYDSWQFLSPGDVSDLNNGEDITLDIGNNCMGEHTFWLQGIGYTNDDPNLSTISDDFYHEFGYALNSIKSQTILTEIQNESEISGLANNEISESITYADGMARTVQSIAIKQSNSPRDIVTPYDYDIQGRQAKSFLPYQVPKADGRFHDQAITDQATYYATPPTGIASTSHPFSETVMENSPMNRVIEQGAPGTTWQPGTGHTIKKVNLTNETNEVYKIEENGDADGKFYGPDSLVKTLTIDENGNFSWEYKDKAGKTILKKSKLGTSNYLYTQYVYDKFGNLKFIVPPAAYDALTTADGEITQTMKDAWVTEFEYDSQNRLIRKTIPEMGDATANPIITGDLYTVYDRLGRAVLTQDPKLRISDQWLFTKFDIHGRAIMTGIYTDTQCTTRVDMQTVAEACTTYWEDRVDTGEHYYTNNAFPTHSDDNILLVTHYDDYDFNNDGTVDSTYFEDTEFSTNDDFDRIKGKVTGTKIKTENNSEDYRVFTGEGPYDNCPSSPSTLYYQGASITLSPGFSTTAGQTIRIGADVNVPGNPIPVKWLTSVSFYDKYGRVIQTQSNNHLSGSNISNTLYDFSGKVVKTKLSHTVGGNTTDIRKRFEYDHAGRLKEVYHSINDATPANDVLVLENNYNELGQLIEKNLHKSVGASKFLQEVDYRYNIRGWLTNINNADLTDDGGITNADVNDEDLFGMELVYENGFSDLGAIGDYYNGNISAALWRSRPTPTGGATNKLGYGYTYDAINQLKTANYGENNGSWNQNNNYTVNDLLYDKNGNIISLQRKSEGNLVDNLTYAYIDNGNQLQNVDDAVETDDDPHFFVEGTPATTEYVYDANGNMTRDDNKGISITSYNHLNLPVVIEFDDIDDMLSGNQPGKIEWTYTTSGSKLRKTVYDGDQISYVKDYVGGFVYTDGNMEFFHMDEGRVYKNTSSFTYMYDYKDHLGNVRMSFTDGGGNIASSDQEDHYYPFGLTMPGLHYTTKANKFTYNGKEFEDDFSLNWYHYGARYYDPQLGRWHVVDAVDEFYNPYMYGPNNPVNGIDKEGKFWEQFHIDFTTEVMKKYGFSDDALARTLDGNLWNDESFNHLRNELHAMRDMGESIESARTKVILYCDNKLNTAVDQLGNADYSSSLFNLGMVMHVAQDKVSHNFCNLKDHFWDLREKYTGFDSNPSKAMKTEAIKLTAGIYKIFKLKVIEKYGDEKGNKLINELKNYEFKQVDYNNLPPEISENMLNSSKK